MDLIDYEIDDRPEVEDATEVEWEGRLEDKPEIEQTLYKLQTIWYATKDDQERFDVWIKMFEYVQQYARSLVLQKLKNKKYLSPDIVADYTSDSALRFMTQYLYRRNFKCGTSFGKMINYKVLEAVYGEKDEDRTVSLYVSDSDDSELDLLSVAQRTGLRAIGGGPLIEEDPSETIARSTFSDLLDEVLEDVDQVLGVSNSVLKLKCRFFINLVLKKPRNRHVKNQFIKHICTSKKEIDTVQLVELELLDRLRRKVEEAAH